METIEGYRIPGNIWETREANANAMELLARDFFAGEDGERAGWFVTHWPESIAEGSDATTCREWLVVHATPERARDFHDLIGQLSGTWNADGRTHRFTPSERVGR